MGKPQRLLSTLRTHLLQMLTSWSSVPTHLRCRTANSANGMMEHSSCVACLGALARWRPRSATAMCSLQAAAMCVCVCVSCLLQYVVQLQWVFERRGGDADGAAVLPR